jgi:hypothetical protein
MAYCQDCVGKRLAIEELTRALEQRGAENERLERERGLLQDQAARALDRALPWVPAAVHAHEIAALKAPPTLAECRALFGDLGDDWAHERIAFFMAIMGERAKLAGAGEQR